MSALLARTVASHVSETAAPLLGGGTSCPVVGRLINDIASQAFLELMLRKCALWHARRSCAKLSVAAAAPGRPEGTATPLLTSLVVATARIATSCIFLPSPKLIPSKYAGDTEKTCGQLPSKLMGELQLRSTLWRAPHSVKIGAW